MPTTRERILEYLRTRGPATDAMLRDALSLTHQTVNQVCRQLAQEQRVTRAEGPQGFLVNSIADDREGKAGEREAR